MSEEKDEPHYTGHRQRLKQRLNVSPESTDYELLELILFFVIPRKDVKPLAKKLLDQFSTLANLINVDKEKLLGVKWTNENLYVSFIIARQLIHRVLKQQIINKNIISSWGALIDYLKASMGQLKLEQFRVIFLNKKNILIADEALSQGTIDQAIIYPREIIKRSLFHEAGAIILVHNHPSGSSQPSKMDIELTNKLAESCASVNISIHDHVIIAGNEYFSFKSNMLL